MEIKKLPGSLLILGGGIIALEFSQLFVRLGVEVTIIQRGDHLTANLEPEISDEIRNVLESAGTKVKTNTNVSSAGSEHGSVYVVDETDKGSVRYRADQTLVAMGRAPNSGMLALEKAGVGLGEATTAKAGYKVKVQRFPFSSHGRARDNDSMFLLKEWCAHRHLQKLSVHWKKTHTSRYQICHPGRM